MLKPLLLLPALLVAAYSPSLNSQQKPAHKPAGEAAPPATIQVEAARPEIKQIYKNDCAICHGDVGDGKGDIGKDMNLLDWTNPTTLAAKSDQELFDNIRKGSAKMPPEDPSRAKDDEIKGLVKFIRAFSKGHAAPAEQPAAQPAPAQAPAAQSTSPTSN
jgi:cytochrome c5